MNKIKRVAAVLAGNRASFVLLISRMLVMAKKFRSDSAWSALRRPTFV